MKLWPHVRALLHPLPLWCRCHWKTWLCTRNFVCTLVLLHSDIKYHSNLPCCFSCHWGFRKSLPRSIIIINNKDWHLAGPLLLSPPETYGFRISLHNRSSVFAADLWRDDEPPYENMGLIGNQVRWINCHIRSCARKNQACKREVAFAYMQRLDDSKRLLC